MEFALKSRPGSFYSWKKEQNFYKNPMVKKNLKAHLVTNTESVFTSGLLKDCSETHKKSKAMGYSCNHTFYYLIIP